MKNISRTILLLTSFAVLALQGCSDIDPDNKDNGSKIPEKSNVAKPINPDRFTILSWTGVKTKFAEYAFPKLIEGGFDTYLDWYDNLALAEEALTEADKYGMKMIVSCPELFRDKTQEVVNAFCKHPSFFAYHIDDEPETSEFASLTGQIANIEKYDTDHPCYVNLYPNWVWGEAQYLTKVNAFTQNVPVKFLSFDNYPCKTEGGVTVVRSDWYHNLEDIRTVANQNCIPIWAFALSLSHSTKEASYPIPSIGELRLQQFSNMLYGATAFQYFTTWGHLQNDHCTGVFDNVAKVNEELLGMQKVFLGADIKYIWHSGAKVPSGTKKLAGAPTGISKIETPDGNAVVSYLINNDKQYIAFVNTNPNGGMDLNIEFADGVTAYVVDKKSNESPFEPGTRRLAAGDIAIYTWK